MNEPRMPIHAEAVAAALGVPLADVTDAEHPLLTGETISLSHSFRVQRAAPSRPSRVQVFTYAHTGWQRTMRDVFAFEVAASAAWWAWVREDLGRDSQGVARIPPLVESATAAFRTFDVTIGDVAYPAWQRPLVEWPDLEHAALAPQREARLWSEFRATAAAVATRLGRKLVIPETASDLDLRRRLLTDGRHLVVSAWRGLDPEFQRVDSQRPRMR